jgi:hypothetical protein
MVTRYLRRYICGDTFAALTFAAIHLRRYICGVNFCGADICGDTFAALDICGKDFIAKNSLRSKT